MQREWMALGGVLGFLGVALGAFGAHALPTVTAGLADLPHRRELWNLAAHYQLMHAVAVVGLASSRGHLGSRGKWAVGAFTLGTLFFSGSLYAMGLGAPRWLGAITPIGGTCFLIGWSALVSTLFSRSRS